MKESGWRFATFAVMLCVVLGCSTIHQGELARLQGTWKGEEIGGRIKGLNYLVVSGQELEFRGADANEWYKATYTLREDTNPPQIVATVTQCPFAQYVGKTSHAIYRVDGSTLTLAGNEPGNPEAPSGFDAPGARRFVLEKN